MSVGTIGVRAGGPALCAVIVLGALVAPAALGAPAGKAGRPPLGSLAQLPGKSGCVVDRSNSGHGCAPVRALRGPAPFLGSNAVTISPDGKNLYVASSESNAITVFKRNLKSGTLAQRPGAAGCIAEAGRSGCAQAVGLDHPNSVAVSADGKNVYATSLDSDAVTIFARNASNGALTQASDGSGCIANAATSGCTTGRALDGPDVVTTSPDGDNVYVGSFFGNAVAVFDRNPSTGALTQPADSTGCIVNTPTSGCTTGLALAAPEGMASSGDGNDVYVATAASNAVLTLARDPSTGALSQATDGSGCIVNRALAGCTTGTELGGANAVAVSSDDGDVYVTSLISNSLTSFTRTLNTGLLDQKSGTMGCVVYVLAVGCSLGRALDEPEGVTVSRDGASVYAGAFGSDAIDVFNRNANTGALMQKSGRPGCVTAGRTPGCTHARALLQPSSLALSRNGRYLYAAGFASDSVDVFKRQRIGVPR